MGGHDVEGIRVCERQGEVLLVKADEHGCHNRFEGQSRAGYVAGESHGLHSRSLAWKLKGNSVWVGSLVELQVCWVNFACLREFVMPFAKDRNFVTVERCLEEGDGVVFEKLG